jgi:hypothetical protein
MAPTRRSHLPPPLRSSLQDVAGQAWSMEAYYPAPALVAKTSAMSRHESSGQDGRAHNAILSNGNGARKASAVSQWYFDGRRRLAVTAVVEYISDYYSIHRFWILLLHPTLPTYPPTLPLTLWGVVWCRIDDGTHARAPSVVARPRRGRSGGSPSVLPCWQSGGTKHHGELDGRLRSAGRNDGHCK